MGSSSQAIQHVKEITSGATNSRASSSKANNSQLRRSAQTASAENANSRLKARNAQYKNQVNSRVSTANAESSKMLKLGELKTEAMADKNNLVQYPISPTQP